MNKFILLLLLFDFCSTSLKLDLSTYYHYDDMSNILDTIEKESPNELCKKFSIGKSVEGRQIYGMKISSNHSDPWKPKVKYIGQIHGNEVIGRQTTIYFIQLLCQQYTKQTPETSLSRRVKEIIDHMHIFIIPSLNPDGFENNKRRNSNGMDLNRNFPNKRFPLRIKRPIQIETQSMIDFSELNRFVLSGCFHGGALVANYPYDSGPNQQGHTEQPTFEDLLFKRLASSYAENHNGMKYNKNFPGGIVSGAIWYVIYGSMQDWSYDYQGCPEITFEVSGNHTKYPNSSQLINYWNENKIAMLSYLEQVKKGLIMGIVKSEIDQFITLSAKITIYENLQIKRIIYTDKNTGIFHVLLYPGNYTFVIQSEGYSILKRENIIVTKRTKILSSPFVFYLK